MRHAFRPRACTRLLAGACMLGALFACTQREPIEKTVLAPTELPLTGADSAVIERMLPAGAYAITLEERGVDVRLVVNGGPRRLVSAEPNPRHGFHTVYVTLPEPASLRVVAEGDDHGLVKGAVTVAIHTWNRSNGPPLHERAGERFAQGTAAYAGDNEKDWRAALADFERSAESFRAAGDAKGQARALHALAGVRYWRLNDWAAAERDAIASAKAYARARDRVGQRRAETLAAAALIEQGVSVDARKSPARRRALFARADRLLESAASDFATEELRIDHAEAINFLVSSFHFRGKVARARQYCARAVELFREAGDPVGEAKALSNLAVIDLDEGRVAQAVASYERLSSLLEKEKDPELYADLLSNYAVGLVQLGDFERALDLYNEFLGIYTRLDNPAQRARQLQRIGTLYFRAGDFERALEAYETALPLRERYDDGRGVIAALQAAGNAAAELGRFDAALGYHRKALALASTPREKAELHVRVASDLRRRGELQAGMQEIGRALAAADDVVRPAALLERGRLRLASGVARGALEDLDAAEQGYQQLGVDFGRIEAATARSKAALAAGDAQAALAAADRAIELIETLRSRMANPETRAHFLASRYEPYAARIAALLASDRLDPQMRAWEALRTAELSRARSLRELLASGSDAENADPELEAARQALTMKQLQLETRLQRYGIGDAEAIELRGQIQEIRAKLDAAWRKSRAQAADAATLASTLPATLREVQAQLSEGKLLLLYFVGEDVSFAWSLSKESLDLRTLPGRAALRELVAHATRSLRVPPAGSSSGKLPSAADLAIDTDRLRTHPELFVLADGPLHQLPFAALRLPSGAATEERLLDRAQVTMLPSLTLAFEHAARGPQSDSDPGKLVAVVSDPVYSPDDARLKPARVANLIPASASAERLADVARLTRLPYSAVEARRVAQSFAPQSVLELQGFEAESARVLELPFDRLGVLHFATHALARADSPMLSALYLTAFDPDGRRVERSRLTLADILARRMRADIVVLSGCGTADGRALLGEGVVGLAHGFLASGSRAVVATLWPVQDAATAALMADFYRELAPNRSAAAALRAAQQHARRRATRDGPSVWSSFVVQAMSFE